MALQTRRDGSVSAATRVAVVNVNIIARCAAFCGRSVQTVPTRRRDSTIIGRLAVSASLANGAFDQCSWEYS